jgi:hypothetical protein
MRAIALVAVAVAAALALAACARGSEVPSVRFANAPPVEVVNDRRDVPRPPASRPYAKELYHFDGSFFRLVTRALELPTPRRALGVNALDEVPDSTWFTNRIGIRALDPDEIRRGPERVGSPEPHKPWTIKSTKIGGGAIGFIIVDARGEKFLLKLENLPEAETAADAIASRLFWAFGFNVPEDHVVYVQRDELVLAPDAVIRDEFGNVRRLRRDELDRRLSLSPVDDPRGLRALASHFLAGKLLGGHPHRGVRADDPNDRIPHELRRDLRGSLPLHAWLDHVDVKEANTLDTWIADPADPDRHYVMRYLIDFGKALGVMALVHENPREGVEYRFDWGAMFASLVSGGLLERDWEYRRVPPLRGVGLYDAATYDPARWKPQTPAYLPLRTADRFDGFWGAKILMRFTREQLAAAVETGRLTDPRASAYLLETLIARQRATARYWFEQVNPIDQFAVEGDRLCFTDLALEHVFASTTRTRYEVTTFDRAARQLGPGHALRPTGSRTCSAPLRLPASREAYTIVRIVTGRPVALGPTYVHLARDPRAQRLRVIGVWRE